MATFDVPESRPRPRFSAVQIGKPVSASSPLIQLGQLLHWVRGRGYSIIPMQLCDVELTSGSEVLRWMVKPSGVAIARVWVVALRSQWTAAQPSVVDIHPNAASELRVFPLRGRDRGTRYQTFLYVETLAAKSAAEQELTFTVEHVSGTRTYIDAIGCWELPRAALAADADGAAVDLGIDIRSLEPGRPIYESANQGLFALVNAVHATQTRRHLLQQWFTVCVFNSGSEEFLWKLAPVIVPTKLGRNAAERFVRVRMYARVTAADTTAELRYFTSETADSKVSAIDGAISTAFDWIGDDDLEPACEDLSDDAGLPGGNFETLQIGITRTAGTGNVEIKGVSVWEPV